MTTISAALRFPAMRTAAQCLAKAAEMDARAVAAISEGNRAECTAQARSWRDIAIMAKVQEALEAKLRLR